MAEHSSAPKPDDGAMSLIEHLAELRTRVIRSVLALVAGIVITFYFAPAVMQFIFTPVGEVLAARGLPNQLITLSPQEQFFAMFRVSLLTGLAVSFPIIAFQMWRFVAPGLYANEKGAFLPFMVASPALFILGAAFAHYVVTPLALNFFISFSDLPALLGSIFADPDTPPVPVEEGGVALVFSGSVKETLDLSLKFIFAFGICFQLPVLLTLMGMAGLVSSEGLKSVRKYAVVGILVVAALVTPPDVITQIILFSVVYALYEVSIWLVMMVERKRARREAEEDLA